MNNLLCYEKIKYDILYGWIFDLKKEADRGIIENFIHCWSTDIYSDLAGDIFNMKDPFRKMFFVFEELQNREVTKFNISIIKNDMALINIYTTIPQIHTTQITATNNIELLEEIEKNMCNANMWVFKDEVWMFIKNILHVDPSIFVMKPIYQS